MRYVTWASIMAISLMLMLATLVSASADVFEPPLPLAPEQPLITIYISDCNLLEAVDAVFQQASGWTYTIHPTAKLGNGDGGKITLDIKDCQLESVVSALLMGSGNGYTITETNYLIHAKDYVVPEPSSIFALLCGIASVGSFAIKRRAL